MVFENEFTYINVSLKIYCTNVPREINGTRAVVQIAFPC